jgi:hypothetical protein
VPKQYTMEGGIDIARDVGELCFGHKMSRFETCGITRASAECVRPGCNMGLTVDTDAPGYDLAIIGSAASHHCASTERPLRNPATSLYFIDPPEGTK